MNFAERRPLSTIGLVLAIIAVITLIAELVWPPSQFSLDVALFSAAMDGTPSDIRESLGAGADINAHVTFDNNNNRMTALHLAAHFNPNPEAIRALLEAGAQVDARDDGQFTPLHLAAAFNTNPEVTATLLAAGADVNTPQEDQATPLHLASLLNANPEMIRMLLEAGAEVDARANGQSPLHYAAGNNTPEVVGALLAGGADITARNRNHETPCDRIPGNQDLNQSQRDILRDLLCSAGSRHTIRLAT